MRWTIVTGRGVFKAPIPHERYYTVAAGGYTVGIYGMRWYPERIIAHRCTSINAKDLQAFYEELGEVP